tara:strand:- start:3885 stop:4571 length:687 start_codon:yes stop_codon:yes gene_type:complete
MKISEYRQMMAYLTREARNPTPRVDMKLRETGAEISKGYADGRLVRPKNLKDKFPKVMFDKSKNKFTAMEPKDDKLVDQIYNSPDPTAAVKKLVKDTAPPDVNTINKELNKYRRPDDQIKTFDNLDPSTYPSDPKQRVKLFEPMLDRLKGNDPKKEAAKKQLKAMDQISLSDEISKISKEITAMEQRNKLLQEMNNIPKPKMERAKESGLSAEFTKEKLDEAKILKDL